MGTSSEAARPTRERILDAAMALFGARGYRATTIGEIESAAGLAPRRGGLYRHFESKEAVFRAAIARYAEKFGRVEGVWDESGFDDPAGALEAAARFTLEGLRAEADLFRIMQRDGTDFPDLAAEVHEQLVGRGYEFTIELFRRLRVAHGLGSEGIDFVSLAAIALGALVHFREDEAIYGRTPAGAEEDAFVFAWVGVWTRVLMAPEDEG